MVYSVSCKYRGTYGNLNVSGGAITFTRTDGFFTKAQRIIIKIPVNAIADVNVEGMISKKLVILVDASKLQGIPRHEFDIANPYNAMQAIREELDAEIAKASNPQVPIKELHEVTTIVKIKCSYCGTLNEITDKKCSGCGQAIGAS
jgi:hypothetical protein